MKVALISVFLCLFVSFNDCRSSEVKSESSEVVKNVEPQDYSVDALSADLSPKKRSIDPADHKVVPLTEKAIKRVKKSLSKNRMKRLTKPKYLEEKLKDLVEQRPEMKTRIKSKLAERKTKKQPQKSPLGDLAALEQERSDVYQVPVYDYNMYAAQAPATPAAAPAYDYSMYAAAAAPATPEAAPAYDYSMYAAAAPATPEAAPAYDYSMYAAAPATPEAAPAYDYSMYAAAPATPEAAPAYDYSMYAAAPATPEAAPAYDPSMYAAAASITPGAVPQMPAEAFAPQPMGADQMYAGANPYALQNNVPFEVLDQLEQDYEPSRVFSRSVYENINEEIALASNPAFEVVPLSENEVFQTEIVPSLDEAAKLLECSFPQEDETSLSELVAEIQTPLSTEVSSEPELTFFSPSEEVLEAEPFEAPEALDGNMKFKKDIPFTQYAKELFYNSLQLTPDYHFPSDYIIESLPCEEHLWAPLEPVKTYELKQVAVDKEAIIAEIKSVLGEVSGPIIIGEPGEPVIVKHFAKPYVIEYFERPVVVEHHQSAALNIFEQAPVIVDHYEPISFTETPGEPLVVIEQLCPCAEEVSPVPEQVLFS